MRNYLTYPTKKMYISQSYTGTYSHQKNYKGTPKDYPIDESCGDSNRDYFYCPCDEVIIKRIYGVGATGTNTIWMQSTSPVVLANGTESYITILVCHPNDDTLKNIKTNQRFKRGEKMFLEGNDGNATGYHFHISVSASKYVSGGWEKNSKGGWVIKGNPIKPEEAFFVDTNFTTIKKSNGLSFKKLTTKVGTPVERDTSKAQIEVIVDELYARKKPKGEILGFINEGIYNITDMTLDDDYTYFEVEPDMWIASLENKWTKLYMVEKNETEEEIKVETPAVSEENTPNSSENEENDKLVEEIANSLETTEISLFSKIVIFLINLLKKVFKK